MNRQRTANPVWLPFAPILFVGMWSTGFIGSRLSAPFAEPLSFLAVRFLIVGIILTIAALISGAHWPRGSDAVWSLIIGALTHGVYLGGVFWAIYYGMPAGVTALITALQPLISTLLAAPLLGEKTGIRHWTGLALGLSGVCLVVWPKLGLGDNGINMATIFAVFAGTFAISLGSILQKIHVGNVDLRTGPVVQFIGGTIVVGIGAMLSEHFQITWNGDVIFALGWLVIVLSLGAISLLYIMLRHGKVSKITGLFFLVPSITALIAWPLFGETLNAIQLSGMAVCAIGVFIVTHKS